MLKPKKKGLSIVDDIKNGPRLMMMANGKLASKRGGPQVEAADEAHRNRGRAPIGEAETKDHYNYIDKESKKKIQKAMSQMRLRGAAALKATGNK